VKLTIKKPTAAATIKVITVTECKLTAKTITMMMTIISKTTNALNIL